jgi:hypothetical protein
VRTVLCVTKESVLLARETWWKTHVEFDNDGREVSYDLVKGFQLLSSKSSSQASSKSSSSESSSPDLMVTVPNIPFFSGAARMKDADDVTKWAFQASRKFP